MPKLKAIFFDYDGVLRDSRGLLWESYEYALKSHNVSVNKEDLLPFVHHVKDLHAEFAHHIPQEEFLRSFAIKRDELLPKVTLYTGVSRLARALVSKGYKLGLITSAASSRALLEVEGIIDDFSVIVGGNDTTYHKPHPEPVLMGLATLQVSPHEVIMIGDTAADIAAAKAAGLRASVGITHGMGTKEILQDAGADYIINMLQEIESVIEEIEHGSQNN